MTVDIATLGISVDSSQVKQGAKSLDDLTASGVRAEKSTASLGKATGVLSSFYGDLAKVLATVGISKFIADTISLNQRYQEMGIVLANVSKNAGLNVIEVNKVTDAVRKSGISMLESRDVVTKLITANIDLAHATELSRLAQDAAVIGQINSSEALGRMIHGITSSQVEVLRGIGINVNFEQSYKKLAAQLGKTTADLSEHEKMQARVNIVLGEAPKLMGTYEASMDNAGKRYRSTTRLVEDLKIELGSLFDIATRTAVELYTQSLVGLTNSMQGVKNSESGIIGWGDTVARVMAFAADGVMAAVKLFKLAGQTLGGFAAQAMAIKNFDFQTVFSIQSSINKDWRDFAGSLSTARDEVEKQIVQRDLLKPIIERETLAVKKSTDEYSKATSVKKEKISEGQRLINALQAEAAQIGKTSSEIKRMEAAQKGVAKAAEPYITAIEKQNRATEIQRIRVDSVTKNLHEYQQIIESTLTDQERFNREVERLNKAMSRTDGTAISVETYTRALRKAQDELDRTKVKTETSTDQITQFWIQANRNIQSSLANTIFDYFNGGLDDMVRSAKNAVLRIMSEFAALKLSQTLGLGSLLAMPGTAAASGVGGTGSVVGTGMDALNIASIGTGAANLIKGGFGLNSIIGGGISGLGGMVGSSSMSAFGTAFAGDAIGGLAAGGFTSSAASAASMGTAFAAAAGPLMIAAAATAGLKALAGDKRMGGGFGKALNTVGDIPIVGDLIPVVPLMNLLFGRGPLKQKETSLTGDIGGTGLLESGELSTHFKAKGGLFRSNKNDFAKADLITGLSSTDNQKALGEIANGMSKFALQIAAQINETVGSVNTGLRSVADSLNLSVDPLDNFKRSINLVSESGKALTDEQISGEISAITEEMARSLLPAVDQFAKFGETAVDTVLRLGSEFEGLTLAVQNLGAQSGHANTIISALTIAERSRIVQMAGGIDAANQLTSFFFSNFLTGGEQLTLKTEQLSNSLTELGVSAALTVDQFKELVQAEGTANELRIALLKLAPAFLEVRNAQTSLGETTQVLATAERSLNDIRQELLGSYNKERSEFENTISKFKTISDKLRDFRESLMFNELSPLTPAQRLDEARQQFNSARMAVNANPGDERAYDQLSQAAQEFLKSSQTINASGAAYLSDFSLVQNVLKNAEKAATSQVDVATKQLNELVRSVDYLLNIDNTTKTTNDLIKELIAATLKGAGNQQYTTADIKGYLAANPNLTPTQVGEAATRYGVSGDQLRAAGYDTSKLNQALKGSSISDKQIQEFVNANRNNPMAIYNAAVANGVTSQRLSSVGGIAMTDIQKFVKDNKLQSFAKGTDFVHKTGIVMAHRGEAIGPSSMPDELKKIREELSALRKDQNEHTGALVNVIDITTKQNSQEISGAVNNAQTQKSWSERNKVAIK